MLTETAREKPAVKRIAELSLLHDCR